MLIKRTNRSDSKDCDVTDEKIYLNRREIIKNMGFLGAGTLLTTTAAASVFDLFGDDTPPALFKQTNLEFTSDKPFAEELTPEEKTITHNNFYEFGAQKNQPAELGQGFKVDPWQLKISGEVEKPFTLDYDDLYSSFDLEERIYRLRCVEA
ncbi:MAG: molybdopterin-dependent oxidoreductase, partial [Porticoccaceae bacterium]|nr:molybdopterin-dependent oxidoreductase [Porticoccaceae bacterium]